MVLVHAHAVESERSRADELVEVPVVEVVSARPSVGALST
jgi:hypothetical protein